MCWKSEIISEIEEERKQRMIAIGNGEACPFCTGENPFISNEGNDILQDLFEQHPAEAERALFGGEDVGL